MKAMSGVVRPPIVPRRIGARSRRSVTKRIGAVVKPPLKFGGEDPSASNHYAHFAAGAAEIRVNLRRCRLGEGMHNEASAKDLIIQFHHTTTLSAAG